MTLRTAPTEHDQRFNIEKKAGGQPRLLDHYFITEIKGSVRARGSLRTEAHWEREAAIPLAFTLTPPPPSPRAYTALPQPLPLPVSRPGLAGAYKKFLPINAGPSPSLIGFPILGNSWGFGGQAV